MTINANTHYKLNEFISCTDREARKVFLKSLASKAGFRACALAFKIASGKIPPDGIEAAQDVHEEENGLPFDCEVNTAMLGMKEKDPRTPRQMAQLWASLYWACHDELKTMGVDPWEECQELHTGSVYRDKNGVKVTRRTILDSVLTPIQFNADGTIRFSEQDAEKRAAAIEDGVSAKEWDDQYRRIKSKEAAANAEFREATIEILKDIGEHGSYCAWEELELETRRDILDAISGTLRKLKRAATMPSASSFAFANRSFIDDALKGVNTWLDTHERDLSNKIQQREFDEEDIAA